MQRRPPLYPLYLVNRYAWRRGSPLGRWRYQIRDAYGSIFTWYWHFRGWDQPEG